MALLGPIDVHMAVGHGLEGPFHADGAHVDVDEHGGDVEHRDHAVHDLGQFHVGDGGAVEWEQQHEAGHDDASSTERGDPEAVSYTHLRAHETDSYLVCRLLLEKKKKN